MLRTIISQPQGGNQQARAQQDKRCGDKVFNGLHGLSLSDRSEIIT